MAYEQLRSFPERMFTPLTGLNRLLYFEVFYHFVRQFDSHIIRKLSFDDAVDIVIESLVREKLHYYIDEAGEIAEKDVRKAAVSIISKLCKSDVGWLKKNDFDLDHNGKSIEVTRTGDYIYSKVILGTFDDLQNERWTCDINAIEDAIDNDDNWSVNPYNNGLMNVLEMTRSVSDRLKQLNTIIEQSMVQVNKSRSLKSITERFSTFYDTFMPLYREIKDMLPIDKRQEIMASLDTRFDDDASWDLLLQDYMELENLGLDDRETAGRSLYTLRKEIHDYFERDCPETIEQIQSKITRYMMITNYQLRFQEVNGANAQDLLERFIIDGRDSQENAVPARLEDSRKAIAFTCPFGYIDRRSLRPARKIYKIAPTNALFDVQISDEERQLNRDTLKKAMNDKFSTENIRKYTNMVMEGRNEIHFKDLEVGSKDDAIKLFLMGLEATSNGYDVEHATEKILKGRFEMDNLGIKRREAW